jgi:hypothetical protein
MREQAGERMGAKLWHCGAIPFVRGGVQCARSAQAPHQGHMRQRISPSPIMLLWQLPCAHPPCTGMCTDCIGLHQALGHSWRSSLLPVPHPPTPRHTVPCDNLVPCWPIRPASSPCTALTAARLSATTPCWQCVEQLPGRCHAAPLTGPSEVLTECAHSAGPQSTHCRSVKHR